MSPATIAMIPLVIIGTCTFPAIYAICRGEEMDESDVEIYAPLIAITVLFSVMMVAYLIGVVYHNDWTY